MKETTAQAAPGSTIASWVDLRVTMLSHRWQDRALVRTSQPGIGYWSNDSEPRMSQEAVDAAGPVDAQNAPTGPWKTADGFPRASTAIIVSLNRKDSQGR